MPKRSKETKADIPPSITPQEAIPKIQRQIERISEIQNLEDYDHPEDAWVSTTVNILNGVFGQPNGEYERRTADIAYAQGGPIRIGMSDEEHRRNFINKCNKRKMLLESYIEQLQDVCPAPHSSVSSAQHITRNTDATCVFIVHGRDTGTSSEVARFAEKLNLNPIILHEQPDEGQTIIEKFEKHAGRSCYAIVLLTADDEGRLRDTDELKPRARQNVILELGYFMGKLSRKYVCAIYESGTELPSDYSGVLYIPLDAEGVWKFKLATELRNAGLNIDMNKLS